MTTAEKSTHNVVNLRAAKKEQAAARKARPAGTARKPAAKKTPAAKAPAASGRPAPQPRPEQRPGEGEIKVRLGAPVQKVLRQPENRKGAMVPVTRKIEQAHVYKDGSVVIVLDAAEANTVKSVLDGQTSRGAQAVLKAIGR
ncbi:hypothetical protein MYCO108962_25960 [Mycobacterium colombiense]|uniref:Uncharacterized protein n=1 Tax=Mycobacterium colombiense CECT 3035 TaxID=1041522 RepID=J4TDZ5_9MYCO|nr:hypothetical protein [Mycobacterium colombiense]EJO87058.1 hypothetical protein MCOL_V219221 [Mycobacterium colombiense CECT 3035]